jgi:hypothetical protein
MHYECQSLFLLSRIQEAGAAASHILPIICFNFLLTNTRFAILLKTQNHTPIGEDQAEIESRNPSTESRDAESRNPLFS